LSSLSILTNVSLYLTVDCSRLFLWPSGFEPVQSLFLFKPERDFVLNRSKQWQLPGF